MSSRFVLCLSLAALLAIAQATEIAEAVEDKAKGMFSSETQGCNDSAKIGVGPFR